MSRRIAANILIAAALSLPATLLANGVRLLSQDAFATARGEAFAATADNASAIYYNPAGITQIEGSDLRSGIYGIYIDPTFRPPPGSPNSGITYHGGKDVAAVPQLFYVHTRPGSPASFGFGVYAPFGLGVHWPQDTGFRAVATRSDLTYITFNPVVALEVAPGFSVGGGLTVNYTDMLLEQGLRAFEQPFTNFFRFKGDGWSVGYNLGLLWKPYQTISIGVSFRGVARVTLDGRTEFQQQPVIAETRVPAQADFTFPLNAVFGISYRPTPVWNVEFNADYTDWSSFGTITIRQGETPPFPVRQDIPFTLRWKSSWAYKFGVTRYFDKGLHVSAGYVLNENSVPDDFYSPLAADLDRHFFSIGTGFRGRRMSLDVAYQFGYGPTRTVSGSTPASTPGQFAGQTADGRYGFTSSAVLVTVGLRF